MHRKKPFSGKKKKEQMKEKRALKSGQGSDAGAAAAKAKTQQTNKKKLVGGNVAGGRRGDSRPRDMRPTLFEDDTRDEIFACRVAASEPLNMELRKIGCCGSGKIRPAISMPLDSTFVPIPKRPQWDYNTTAKELEEKEQKVFNEWLNGLRSMPGAKEHLNWFECNLETWRQLWRVCERSDIILYVVDSRNPLFHFSRAMYEYVVNDLKKPFVVVLSKTDLSDPETLDKWEAYLRANLKLADIVRFSAFKGFHSPAERDINAKKNGQGQDDSDDDSDNGDTEEAKLRKAAARRGTNKYSSPSGREMVLDVIRDIARKYYGERLEKIQSHLLDPQERENGKRGDEHIEDEFSARPGEPEDDAKIEGEDGKEVDEEEEEEDDDPFNMVMAKKKDKRKKKREERKQKRKESTIATKQETIVVGTIGNPNMGKSAMINGLALHKVVSVSRTPGHTKNFQTYNLAHDIILCDCPGMVFPAIDRPKYMQVLCGLYPLANLREPYTPIRYVAEHISLEDLYNLHKYVESEHEDSDEAPKDIVWSPMRIAEALAHKRGYHTGRAGRPDTHRAARDILFDVVDGVVPLYWAPPEPLDVAEDLQKKDAERYASLFAKGMEVVKKEKAAHAADNGKVRSKPSKAADVSSNPAKDEKDEEGKKGDQHEEEKEAIQDDDDDDVDDDENGDEDGEDDDDNDDDEDDDDEDGEDDDEDDDE